MRAALPGYAIRQKMINPSRYEPSDAGSVFILVG